MILVDFRIREAVESGELGIENFDDECVQPATYDLRIGSKVYQPGMSKPIDLSNNGGAHRVAPYGVAVLQTFETLKMPADMIGRFGLKSGFARRGLFASTGPQVDPGFEGKLIVTLINQTPRAHVIAFKETFLSIEFHRLQDTPSQTYHGPYQHRKDVGPEILADLVRMEGLDLSQMQMQFTELAQHVKEWSNLAARFDEFLSSMTRHNEVLEMLTEQRIAEDAPIETREISREQAAEEVLRLFRKQADKSLYYSDIAEELRLDFATVIQACKDLQENGQIEGSKE